MEDEERVVKGVERRRFNKRTGKWVRKVGRPKVGIEKILDSLRLLVRSKAFGRLGLTVRVFDEKVWDLWRDVVEEAGDEEIIQDVLDLRRENTEEEVLGSQEVKKKARIKAAKGDGLGGVLGLDISGGG